jgi:DNA helicase II / ATP-dependent DNA helicase PcrA
VTEEQARVAAHFYGPAVVQAGPGSGKTFTERQRVIHLVKNGARPERIALLAFTRANADEMKQKLPKHCKKVVVKTTHGLAMMILKAAKKQGLYHRNLKPTFVNDILAQLGIDDSKGDLETYLSVQKASARLPSWRGLLPWTPYSCAMGPYRRLYARLERYRHQHGLLTFDDMLLDALLLMKQHETLRKQVALWFDHVVVDEFQDVNYVQFWLLDMVAAKAKSYMVIGDEAQAIYGFRGASSAWLDVFAQRYGAATFTLSDNFRSRGEVTTFSNRLLPGNKPLSTTKGFGGSLTISYRDDFAADVAQAVKVFEPREIAVLVRTFSQLPNLEADLLRSGVPYKLHGEKPFYEDPRLLPVIRTLQRALFETLPERRTTPAGAIRYDRALKEGRGDLAEKLKPTDHAAEAFRVVADSLGLTCPTRQGCERLAQGQTLEGFIMQLEYASSRKQGRDPLGIQLMTVFASKGLEFKVVFVPDCNAGIYPHHRAAVDEERRVFFVAITRAQEELYIYADPALPSPFLDEAQAHHTVAQARAIGQLLAKERLNREEALQTDVLVSELQLERYIEHWYSGKEVVACIARAIKELNSHRQVYWQNVLKRFEVETRTDGSHTRGEELDQCSSDLDDGHVQSMHKL